MIVVNQKKKENQKFCSLYNTWRYARQLRRRDENKLYVWDCQSASIAHELEGRKVGKKHTRGHTHTKLGFVNAVLS